MVSRLNNMSTALLGCVILSALVAHTSSLVPAHHPTTDTRKTFSSKQTTLQQHGVPKLFHSPLFRRSRLSSTIADVIVNGKDSKEAVLETDTQPEKEEEQFNWFKTWYTLVPVEILDEEKPHRFQLLGMDVVVWKDSAVESANGEVSTYQSKKQRSKKAKRVGGQWRAFVDECPHRKVPLSEGRIEEDGSLLCSYHGWRFDGCGDVVNVPQIENEPKTLASVKNNPKSKCNSFPVQVIDGLLWIWPETGSDARIESALKPVPSYYYKLKEKNVDESRMWYGPWGFRELPYGADYFIENVVDPAHVPVSHHNIVGSRYGDLTLKLKEEVALTKNGFSIKVENPNSPPSTTTFTAPGSVDIEVPYNPDDPVAFQTLELYSSPSRPGFCYHVGRQIIVKGLDGKMPALLRQFSLPLPKWVNHIMASAFLNQDALFLHHQERYLHKTGQYSSLMDDGEMEEIGAYNYNKAVLPINADSGVVLFRNWIRKLAGGRIPYKNKPSMPDANNEVVFDVWNAHTKHCKYCLAALANLKKARFVAFFVATILGSIRPIPCKVLNTAIVLATAGLGLALNKLIGMFYRYEFSHAHND